LGVALCLLLSTAGTIAGQAVNGALLGTITDAVGAVVPGTSVTITETRTGISNETTTNERGNYSFPNAKDGIYRVEASLAGFKKVVRDNVIVDVNTTVRVDLTLEVGSVTETVSVEVESPLLQTDRADTGRLLESKQVAELPLAFNRNFQGLLVTVPGATHPTREHSAFFNSQDSLAAKVNGQSRLSNNFQIEGVDDNEKTGLLQILIPAADAIEAVSISTSNFDAEFGRAGGAVSSVTLKSGTNDIHGSAFVFGNNDNTQAGDYFTHIVAPTHYRQAGATIGGPIKKNKLFYFGDYQYTTDELGTVNRLTVPYPAWFNGDFSNAPTKIYDPAMGNPDGTGRTQFEGNIIKPDRISPIVKKMLTIFQNPNIANSPLGTPNYVFNEARIKTTNAFDTKINYNIRDKDFLSYRFSFQRPNVFDPDAYGIYGGPNSGGGFGGTGIQNTVSTAANYTHTFGPKTILETRFGLSWYHNVAVSQADGLKTSSEFGIPGVNVDNFSSGLTTINITGFTTPTLGFVNSLPWDRGEKTYIGSGILSKVIGNHSLKIGEEIRHNRDFLLQIQDQGGVRGQFTYNGGRTAIPSDTAAQNGIANAFASFLLDQPSGYSRDIKIFDQPGTQHYAYFSFVQDNWQATKRLTINLGLRHEYYTPLVGLVDKGGLSNYIPGNNTEIVAGYGSVPKAVGVTGTWKNFAIRSGASFRINDKTVIRAGYGESIIPFPDNSYAFNFPVKQNNQFSAPNSFVAVGSLATGFTTPTVFDIPVNGIIDASLPILKNSSLYYAPPNLKEGKLHSYNVAFQEQLPGRFTAEAAYVGNYGRGILATIDLNAASPNSLGLATYNSATQAYNDNPARPLFNNFGRTASVTSRVPTDTHYNSLQVKVDRRFSNGLLLTSNYTLSQAITASGDDNGTIDTPANPKLDIGRAGFDRTHAFNSSFVWLMPFARNLHGVAKSVLDGWQVSGVFTRLSGTPLDFTVSGTNLHAPGNTQRPNLTVEPRVSGKAGPGQLWFDTSVFSNATPAVSIPLKGTSDPNALYAPFGSLTRNSSINGPGYLMLDSTIIKRFKFSEFVNGEIRADFFNILNHANFSNPQTSVTSTTFGQITGTTPFNSYANPRVVRFGARITF
jgi:hypothetical protein